MEAASSAALRLSDESMLIQTAMKLTCIGPSPMASSNTVRTARAPRLHGLQVGEVRSMNLGIPTDSLNARRKRSEPSSIVTSLPIMSFNQTLRATPRPFGFGLPACRRSEAAGGRRSEGWSLRGYDLSPWDSGRRSAVTGR